MNSKINRQAGEYFRCLRLAQEYLLSSTEEEPAISAGFLFLSSSKMHQTAGHKM
jgi:hypothetical protein